MPAWRVAMLVGEPPSEGGSDAVVLFDGSGVAGRVTIQVVA
jgi:hypothetical protein